MDISYEIIRSSRSTVGLQVTEAGKVVVRAPYLLSKGEIDRIVQKQQPWIETHLQRAKQRQEKHPEPSPEQRKAYIKKAKEILPPKLAYYAKLMGVKPTGLTITSAKTRFGSCSAKNSISFSWRLMEYPEEAIDYVVVHELAHIKQHNHSPAFYAEIAKILPDHKERRNLLRNC